MRRETPSGTRNGGALAAYVKASAAGCRIAVRVHPGARRSRICGIHGDAVKLEVAAPAERGAANRAVEELLAETLGVAARDVRIVAGGSSRNKTVAVAGRTPADAVRCLEPFIARRVGQV